MLSSCFETTSHAHALLNLVSNASIERDDLMIDCTDLKIDFRAAEPAQAVLRCTHQLSSESAPAILGRNGQVVDPAPQPSKPAITAPTSVPSTSPTRSSSGWTFSLFSIMTSGAFHGGSSGNTRAQRRCSASRSPCWKGRTERLSDRLVISTPCLDSDVRTLVGEPDQFADQRSHSRSL